MAPGSISIECQEEGKSREEGVGIPDPPPPARQTHDSDTSQKKFPPPTPVCSENVLLLEAPTQFTRFPRSITSGRGKLGGIGGGV